MAAVAHAFITLIATGYLALLVGAGIAFLVFLFAPADVQDRWNALNATDPEDDFTHEPFELPGY